MCGRWFLLAFVVTGCALTYRAPGADSAKLTDLAIVENDRHWMNNIIIDLVDRDDKVGVGHLGRLELPPGQHSISATWRAPPLEGQQVTRWFRAQAGQHYRLIVLPNFTMMRWRFAVIHVEAGRAVDFDIMNEPPETANENAPR